MRCLICILCFVASVSAHVGSPDIFFEGIAGAYPLSVAIRTPTVIPGIAEVQIRTTAPGVRSVTVVPYPLTGPASKYPPTPDVARVSQSDPHFYTSSVWLMAFGSYQVRIDVEGLQGRGMLSIPVPSVARETKQMQSGLGWALAAMMVLIVGGAVAIIGAAAREATLPAGEAPGTKQRNRARMVMAVAVLGILGFLWMGNWWWNVEAKSYAGHVYRQPTMEATIHDSTLLLQLEKTRKPDDYLPDHEHLMHLFVVRMPEMDRMWHLHPELIGNSEFSGPLPALAAGHYKLFADIVYGSGFPETPVAEIQIDHAIPGKPLLPDDAEGTSPPLSRFDANRSTFTLPDGFQVKRIEPSGTVPITKMQHLSFEVDALGRPATDLESYMGMPAHAEIISADATVFAHIHPSGSVPMASLGLTTGKTTHEGMEMSMPMSKESSAHLTFPYGFPKPGRYRLFLQIQRAGHPETAAFDFAVQ